MNVGNNKIHQWVIATYPEKVSHYIQYDNKNIFDPITLNCEIEEYQKYGK